MQLSVYTKEATPSPAPAAAPDVGSAAAPGGTPGAAAAATPTAAPAPGGDLFTINDLAQQAGMTVRNVRAYQTRGLLPAPTEPGRGRSKSRYSSEHLDRLKTIEAFRKRGFSLAAITELVGAREERLERDRVLGTPNAQFKSDALRAQNSQHGRVREVPQAISREELETLLPEIADNPVLLARAIELGVTSVDHDRFTVPAPAVFRLGAEMSALGLPLGDLLDIFEYIDAAADHVTLLFIESFREHVWEAAVADGLPSERLAEITAALKQLPQMTADAVQVIFGQSLEKGQSFTGLIRDE